MRIKSRGKVNPIKIISEEQKMKRLFKITAALIAITLLPVMQLHAEAEEPLTVYTIAGIGSSGIQDGEAASFHMPMGLLVLPGGEIIVADTYNNLLRRIDAEGMTETFAGAVFEFFPLGVHLDRELMEAGFHQPAGLAVCQHGRIYVADSANSSIRAVIGDRVYTLVSWGEPGFADGPRGEASMNGPLALTVGPSGYIYVADTLNHVIRRVSLTGHTTTIAGVPGEYGYENGNADAALFDSPSGIVVAADGRIFVADTGNHVIRVIENGMVSTFAGSFTLEELDEDDPEATAIGGFAGGEAAYAMFNHPRGLALWGEYLIVADSANHGIRLVSPEGYVTTLAGTGMPGYLAEPGRPALFSFPTDVFVHEDRLYVADAGNNKIRMIPLYVE